MPSVALTSGCGCGGCHKRVAERYQPPNGITSWWSRSSSWLQDKHHGRRTTMPPVRRTQNPAGRCRQWTHSWMVRGSKPGAIVVTGPFRRRWRPRGASRPASGTGSPPPRPPATRAWPLSGWPVGRPGRCRSPGGCGQAAVGACSGRVAAAAGWPSAAGTVTSWAGRALADHVRPARERQMRRMQFMMTSSWVRAARLRRAGATVGRGGGGHHAESPTEQPEEQLTERVGGALPPLAVGWARASPAAVASGDSQARRWSRRPGVMAASVLARVVRWPRWRSQRSVWAGHVLPGAVAAAGCW